MNRTFSDHNDTSSSPSSLSQRGAESGLPLRVLVVGAESVVGANVAAEAAQKHQVVALTAAPRVRIEGCEMMRPAGDRTVQDVLKETQPDAVIHCGPVSRSSWDTTAHASLDETVVDDATNWASAAKAQGCRFVFVSSDAVFTGPWMFHDEDSECLCPTAQADVVRQAEATVQSCCPAALVIRTNAYGWAPAGAPNGWIEQILIDLERRSLSGYDFVRHATPILATDLADILLRAIDEKLSGLYHVAGAERVNPLQFAQRLADHFEMPWLAVRRSDESLDEVALGFGAGEASLQTKKVRKALCVAMPMLSEGLNRLRRQQMVGCSTQDGPDAPVAVRQSA